MKNIEKLKSTIASRNGLARTNQFRVLLPTNIPGITLDMDTLDTLCENVNLPGKQILTSNRVIGMEFQKVAYGYAVDDVSMTFMETSDMPIKKYFDAWRSTILDEVTQTVAYKVDYQRTIKIFKMDNQNRSTYGVELLEAFPTTISSVVLGNDDNQYVRTNIQISYTNWKTL